MLELSFDPEARSIYCYFTAITEGDDAAELQLDGDWLLDSAGQIVGLRFEQPAKHPNLLAFVAEEPMVSTSAGRITLRLSERPAVQALELDYGVLVDVDAQGRAIGIEAPAMIEFGIAERLEAVQPLLVAFDDEPIGNEGPAVFAPSPEVGDDNAAEPEVAAVDATEGRSGFVALVGKPNVGKSTLMNALLGQKISIVSPKPQTTRVPVRGIYNPPGAQIIFIDTPGIHQPRHRLGNFMVEVARRMIPDADVICFMVDVASAPSKLDKRIADEVRSARKPTILVLNKVDVTNEADVHLQQYRELGPWDSEVAISARNRLGLETLVEALIERLPAGPPLYPDDQISDLSERELAAEMIREKILLNIDQEVPHSVAVEVEEWEQREKVLYIRANISVEKTSQKAIIIGSGGEMLRKIGAAARYEIERALGQQIYLDLWVKVRENWRQNANDLRWLGYDMKQFKK